MGNKIPTTLIKKKMSRTFVISDTWFNRLFEDDQNANVVDNNEHIIENWNNTIENDDTVYVLGGFGIGDLYQILVRLKGKIHFLNNYFTRDEKCFLDDMKKCVSACSDPEFKTRVVFENNQIVVLTEFDAVLSYFPLLDWIGKETGTYCFHGLNGFVDMNDHNISCSSQRWDAIPVNIEEVKNNITQFNKNIVE